MKINIFHIIRAHFATLHVEGRSSISWGDIFIFIFVPAILGFCAAIFGVAIDSEAYAASISVFAIFAALLFSVQVAIFGIAQREWTNSGDQKIDSILEKRAFKRKALLRETNTNISYMIVLSCVSVTIFLIFCIVKLNCGWPVGVSVLLYSHFIFTLLMLIKRAHALFQTEYDQ